MPSDFCYGCLCFVPLEGDVPQIFGFSEFITGLALMVLAWTIAGATYRFRVKTAPIPLVNVTFGVATVIGILTLLTDVWRAERWLVPAGHFFTPVTWQALLGAIFLLTFLTWGWFAIVRPATFGRANAERYKAALYGAVLRGSPSELPEIAHELIRSAKSLIHYATDVRGLKAERGHDKSGQAQRLSRVTEVANGILLLVGHPRFCRAVVEAAPAAAWAIFSEIADTKKYGVPVGVFASNIVNEALTNRNSFLFHETEGYASGLVGIDQPLSQAMFGNHEMVEEVRLLDVDWKVRRRMDAEQWTAYCRAVLISLADYLERDCREPSPVLYSAMDTISQAVDDLHTVNGLETDWPTREPLERLQAVMQFVRDAVDVLDKKHVPRDTPLWIHETWQQRTIYDNLAKMIHKVIRHAAYVQKPTDICWSVQYASVWSDVFRDYDSKRAAKIIQHKVRRLLYNDVAKMTRFPNYQGAHVLALCLNVLGFRVSRAVNVDRDSRALHAAIRTWTIKNYERLHAYDARIAETCLPDGVTYDKERHRLIKIHLTGMRRTPVRTELELAVLEPDKTDSASTEVDDEPAL